MTSCSLRKIFGLILHIGNILNHDAVSNDDSNGLKDTTVAIHVSSLPIIEALKGYDTQHTNFLQYIVYKLQNDMPHVLQSYRNDFMSPATFGTTVRKETTDISLPLLHSKLLITVINQYPESARNLHNIQHQFDQLNRILLDWEVDDDNRTGSSSCCSTKGTTNITITKLRQYIVNVTDPIRHVIIDYNHTCRVLDRLLHYFGEDCHNHNNSTVSSSSSSRDCNSTDRCASNTDDTTRTAPLPAVTMMNVVQQNAALQMIQQIAAFVTQFHDAIVKRTSRLT